MIKHYHPYSYLLLEFLRLYDTKEFNFNLIIVHNYVPVEYNFAVEVDKSFWYDEVNKYALLHFLTHSITIKPATINKTPSIHIVVLDKTNDNKIMAEYNTIDYRFIYDSMIKYFN